MKQICCVGRARTNHIREVSAHLHVFAEAHGESTDGLKIVDDNGGRVTDTRQSNCVSNQRSITAKLATKERAWDTDENAT